MKDVIDDILLSNFIDGDWNTARTQLIELVKNNKIKLLKSILDDMDGVYSEYHRDIVEKYLEEGC